MGKILNDILNEIPSDDLIIQVKEICNKIFEEEKSNININSLKILPEGANIFLALEVPPKNKGMTSFLTLERDPIDEFVCNYYSIKISDIKNGRSLNRYQSHKIEGLSAKKIITEYAKLLKTYRGE